jgi:hypothetical protein
VNSRIALWPPDFVGDEDTPLPQNKFQRWLWANWMDFCEYTERLGERVIIINGDMVQGINPSQDTQLMSVCSADMMEAAVSVLKPLIDSPGVNSIFVNRGTDFHDAVGGSDSEKIAREIGAKRDGESGKYSRWALKLELDGLVFAFTHHTSTTSVYHTTPPAREWKQAKEIEVDRGIKTPDVIVRSHVHRWGVFPDNRGTRWYFTTPGFQLVTPYVYKRQPLSLPDIGGLILWVEERQVHWEPRLYELPLPTTVKITSNSKNSLPLENPKTTRATRPKSGNKSGSVVELKP